MKKSLLMLGIATTLTFAQDNLQDVAKKYSMDYMESLKGKLVSKMQEGGPLNAITFCSNEAISLTNEFNSKIDKNVSIKRVSERNRNPLNLPNIADLKALDELEHSRKEFVTYEDKSEFKFYKAIKMDTKCLVCHGSKSEIPTDVQAFLTKTYKNDLAINHKDGDLRGAIVVTIKK